MSYYPQFKDEEIEARESKWLAPGHSKQNSYQEQYILISVNPKFMVFPPWYMLLETNFQSLKNKVWNLSISSLPILF